MLLWFTSAAREWGNNVRMRWWVLFALLASACGRLGYDGVDGAGVDPMQGEEPIGDVDGPDSGMPAAQLGCDGFVPACDGGLQYATGGVFQLNQTCESPEPVFVLVVEGGLPGTATITLSSGAPGPILAVSDDCSLGFSTCLGGGDGGSFSTSRPLDAGEQVVVNVIQPDEGCTPYTLEVRGPSD